MTLLILLELERFDDEVWDSETIELAPDPSQQTGQLAPDPSQPTGPLTRTWTKLRDQCFSQQQTRDAHNGMGKDLGTCRN